MNQFQFSWSDPASSCPHCQRLVRHSGPTDPELTANSASSLQDSGIRLLEAHHPTQALPYLTGAIQLSPKQLSLWEHYITALMQSGSLATLSRLFAAGIPLAPRSALIGHLKSSFAELNALMARLNHGGSVGDNAIMALVQGAPEHAPNWNLLGRWLFERAAFKPALTAWQQALSLAHDNVATLNYLGALAQRESCLPQAQGLFERALLIKPDFADAHNNLGTVLLELDQAASAVAHHRNALKAHPDHPQYRLNLALSLSKLNEIDEALASFDRALELDRENPDIWVDKSRLYLDREDYQLACGCLESALKLRPDHPKAHFNLAMANLGLGQINTAIRLLEQTLKLDASCSEACFNLSYLENQRGSNLKALEYLRAGFALVQFDSLAFSNYLFFLNYEIDCSSALLHQESLRYGAKALESAATCQACARNPDLHAPQAPIPSNSDPAQHPLTQPGRHTTRAAGTEPWTMG